MGVSLALLTRTPSDDLLLVRTPETEYCLAIGSGWVTRTRSEHIALVLFGDWKCCLAIGSSVVWRLERPLPGSTSISRDRSAPCELPFGLRFRCVPCGLLSAPLREASPYSGEGFEDLGFRVLEFKV